MQTITYLNLHMSLPPSTYLEMYRALTSCDLALLFVELTKHPMIPPLTAFSHACNVNFFFICLSTMFESLTPFCCFRLIMRRISWSNHAAIGQPWSAPCFPKSAAMKKGSKYSGTAEIYSMFQSLSPVTEEACW